MVRDDRSNLRTAHFYVTEQRLTHSIIITVI